MSIHAPHIHTYTTRHMSIIYMTTHVQYTNTYTTCITKTYMTIHAPHTHMHHQTHVHHQIPPKYKIYPVGLPSVLYETPGPNERSVLNQLFLVLFIVLFMKTATLFTKTATFHENHNSFHENCHFSWKLQQFSLWAFGLSPSIGLSFERPKRKWENKRQWKTPFVMKFYFHLLPFAFLCKWRLYSWAYSGPHTNSHFDINSNHANLTIWKSAWAFLTYFVYIFYKELNVVCKLV